MRTILVTCVALVVLNGCVALRRLHTFRLKSDAGVSLAFERSLP